MKKKLLLSLLAAVTAGSVLFCSGCSVDLTSINEEDATLSAEIETDNLTDGTLQIHSIWYQNGGEKLTSAAITFSSGDGEIYSGVTDDSGQLDACTLPGNTILTCEVADSTGAVIASSEIIFKISSDYSALTIYTPTEEDNECILEIPTDKTDIRAAIFLTESGQLSFANLTPWSDSYDEETADTGDDASAENEDASAEGSSEGEDASAEGSSEGEDTSAEGDGAAEETTEEATDNADDTSGDNTDDTSADGTTDTAAE
ncbi:MAG: hypothetical protein LIO96_06885 [Lachnospiraceae bacterium]|nr:hypothetical protein [Lachnospiraceae bacterium]